MVRTQVRKLTSATKPRLISGFGGLKRVLRWLTTPLFLLIFISFLVYPRHQDIIYGEPSRPVPQVKLIPKLQDSPLQPVSQVEAVYVAPIPKPQPVSPTPVVVAGCGDNQYANYIYMHESGCNTGATNYLGCYGIGQACPASKVSYCGADYACQNQFFTSYANSVYGGWYNAYIFWTNNSWW